MPTTDGVRIEAARKRADELGLALAYISKSRVTKYVKCPEKFARSYIHGEKEPENKYMRRGTDVHTVFEFFYANAVEFVAENHRTPTFGELSQLLPSAESWKPYTDPYISSFLAFEARRIDRCNELASNNLEATEYWLPDAVEGEFWLDNPLGLDHPDESIPLMGFADLIVRAVSLGIDTHEEDVAIIDFKTGKTPKEQYRDEGIYLEGSFYRWLVEGRFNVAAVAGYYPKNDDLIISTASKERQLYLEEIVADLTEIARNAPGTLPIKTGPLCHWGNGKCFYYDTCRSTWGEPFVHEERFRAALEAGMSDREIADDLGTTLGAVRYAKKKLT
jgi:RecB family exonuclease